MEYTTLTSLESLVEEFINSSIEEKKHNDLFEVIVQWVKKSPKKEYLPLLKRVKENLKRKDYINQGTIIALIKDLEPS